MSTENSAGAASANNSQQQDAKAAQTANANQTVTLTAEQIQSMIDSKVEQVRNTAFAEARRIFEGKKAPEKKTTEQTADATQTLREQVAELQADRKAQQDEKRLLEIEKAAVKAGVDSARLDIFVDHVLTRHGSRIQVEGRNVVWLDKLDQPQTLDALITDVMKTKGDIFRPAANVPRAKALQSGGSQQRGAVQPDAVTEWDGMTQEQINKLSGPELIARARAAVAATQQG